MEGADIINIIAMKRPFEVEGEPFHQYSVAAYAQVRY